MEGGRQNVSIIFTRSQKDEPEVNKERILYHPRELKKGPRQYVGQKLAIRKTKLTTPTFEVERSAD